MKKKQRLNCDTYKVCLTDNFPTKLATVDVDNCIKKYNLNTLLSEYRLPNELISQNELDNELADLIAKGPFNSFRGKYELEFTFKFIDKMVKETNQKLPSRKVQNKISATLNKKCFMSDYAQYADIADGLLEYLQKVKVGL